MIERALLLQDVSVKSEACIGFRARPVPANIYPIQQAIELWLLWNKPLRALRLSNSEWSTLKKLGDLLEVRYLHLVP